MPKMSAELDEFARAEPQVTAFVSEFRYPVGPKAAPKIRTRAGNLRSTETKKKKKAAIMSSADCHNEVQKLQSQLAIAQRAYDQPVVEMVAAGEANAKAEKERNKAQAPAPLLQTSSWRTTRRAIPVTGRRSRLRPLRRRRMWPGVDCALGDG